jgi:hypothetical protein
MAPQRLRQRHTISRFAAGALMTRKQLASRFFWHAASHDATLQLVPNQQQQQQQQRQRRRQQM